MKHQTIVEALTAATDTLLETGPKAAPRRWRPAGASAAALCLSLPGLLHAAEPGEWSIDSAILFYSETDRVSAVEPVISATRQFTNDRSLSAKLVYDALTGASPSGAVPSSMPQTYTRPSGEGSYTTAPGEIPLDDTFRDSRIAVSGNWAQPAFGGTGTLGFNVSSEYDYLSLGVNTGYAYDFAKNNATLSFGLGYAADTIEPEGGVPVAGSCLFGASASSGCTETSFDETRRGGDESKDTLDLLLGYTQVLGVNTVAQFNVTLSQSDGYHTDPFKVVSVVDTDNSVGNGIGEAERHIHESRPDSRVKQGLFFRLKHMLFGSDVLDASYRFQTDDWGMSSHTLDLRYRWALGDHHAITPHLRYYDQSAVDFYTPFLRDDQPLPTEYTADYRQGSFTGITVGAEYETRIWDGTSLRFALEYYEQNGDDPANAPGQLAGREIFPDMQAVMGRINFDFDW
ncbi:DUF3570 domain-containing protein [uncultured Abyssibacter sp.]|uniref:DUF3570 domain-containing protein n=1 Tax=uncultured Abyssibacter sp. TaxID=2320202 RepID=UPI0032B16D9F